MSGIMYSYMRPATYTLQLRPGVENIKIDVSWEGEGSVGLELASPTKNYTENQMKITDMTTIHVDTIVKYCYRRRYELNIPKLSAEETWTIKLNLQNIFAYTLDVEAS